MDSTNLHESGHDSNEEPQRLEDAAQRYAALPWRVFPCKRDKSPLTRHGFHDATTDSYQIEAWWTEHPEASIGVACDKSGFFVLDVDPRHAGDAELAELFDTHGPLPRTVESATGGNGQHFFFKLPEGCTLKGKLGQGLDVKGNGYVILPPSSHPSGGTYRWVHAPWDVAIADAPPWLLALVMQPAHASHGTGNAHTEFNEAEIDDALRYIPAVDRDIWWRVGMAIHFFDSRAKGFEKWVAWSATCPEKFNLDDCKTVWRSFGKSTPDKPITPKTIFDLAIARGWTQNIPPGHDTAAENEQGESTSAHVPWPMLDDAALHGLAGDIVRTIDPHTEGDPVAVLLNVVVGVGNCIGAIPHALVSQDRHPCVENLLFVGDTSKGRKGTAWSIPRHLLSLADPTWAHAGIKSGLSSAEGLIYHVRDALYKKQPVREKGRVVEYQDVLVEEAVEDKRLLIIEPEFAQTLTVMNREGNTLSSVIRDAWDRGDLATLTRNSPLKATGAHISLIGHITEQELGARLDDTSKGNGFANRFLFALVRRSKELPEGGMVPEIQLHALADRLKRVLTFARTVTTVRRDDEARALWASVYHDLSEAKPGLIGAVIARAEAHVLRLSLLYALLDESAVIRVEHLRAALAVWDYCERSAVLIFGDKLGDPTADRILEAIRQAGTAGMTENDLYELFGRNKSANERTRALQFLLSLGLIQADKEETGGRPRTTYRAT